MSAGEVAWEDSKFFSLVVKNHEADSRGFYSLAIAEMKILLREVYSKYRTTVSSRMDSDMEMEDQIIASRPKGQCCKIVFEKI